MKYKSNLSKIKELQAQIIKLESKRTFSTGAERGSVRLDDSGMVVLVKGGMQIRISPEDFKELIVWAQEQGMV